MPLILSWFIIWNISILVLVLNFTKRTLNWLGGWWRTRLFLKAKIIQEKICRDWRKYLQICKSCLAEASRVRITSGTSRVNPTSSPSPFKFFICFFRRLNFCWETYKISYLDQSQIREYDCSAWNSVGAYFTSKMDGYVLG